MNLIFVTYHVEVSEDIERKVLSMQRYFSRFEPMLLIKALFESARLQHSSCRTVLLTDKTTQFSGLPESVEIYRYGFDISKLTMSRTQAQLEFLKGLTTDSHVIFLDSDILVQECLSDIFMQEFDVGVTYKQHVIPINGGVIFIHGKSRSIGCSFLGKIVELMEEQFQQFQTWYGSQYALRQIIPIPSHLKDESIIGTSNGIKILLLPANKYNFTTPGRMQGYYPEKAILHFKGFRKKYLLPYLQSYLMNDP